jgi:hypothetical protein
MDAGVAPRRAADRPLGPDAEEVKPIGVNETAGAVVKNIRRRPGFTDALAERGGRPSIEEIR